MGCKLRLMYCPTWGSTGVHRSPGPLVQDIEKKCTNSDEKTDPREFHTKSIGLEAAEESTMRRLQAIQSQRKALGSTTTTEIVKNHGKGTTKGKIHPAPKKTPAKGASEGYPNMFKTEAPVPPEMIETHNEDWEKVNQ